MHRDDLTDCFASLTLYRMRSWMAVFSAIGSTLIPITLIVVTVANGAKLLALPPMWIVLAIFVGISYLRWKKAFRLYRKFQALRDEPRLSLRREGLILRGNGRHDREFDYAQAVLLPWDQLHSVEVLRRGILQVVEVIGEVTDEAEDPEDDETYEISIDYSQIELGLPLADVAETIRSYQESPRERERLPLFE